MLQVYFLSVLLLIVAGVSLLTRYLGDGFKTVKVFFGSRLVRLLFGTGSVVIGVLKLFIRAPFDTVQVAGDLLPALIGIVVGLALIFDPFIPEETEQPASDAAKTTKKAKAPSKFNEIAARYRLPLAIVAIATGVVHLVVPSLPIL